VERKGVEPSTSALRMYARQRLEMRKLRHFKHLHLV
jgi:hypothetical protein